MRWSWMLSVSWWRPGNLTWMWGFRERSTSNRSAIDFPSSFHRSCPGNCSPHPPMPVQGSTPIGVLSAPPISTTSPPAQGLLHFLACAPPRSRGLGISSLHKVLCTHALMQKPRGPPPPQPTTSPGDSFLAGSWLSAATNARELQATCQ